MVEVLYPKFHPEVIDVISESSPNCITSLQFSMKGKDDLVVFGLGEQNRPSEVLLYENPRNLEFDDGIQDESLLVHWNRLVLQALKQPSSCVAADITGNGFDDLVVTCEYGESLDAMDPYGGRICWLENFGTNEGDWSCHEIGRFPGVNCVKVGHFTTTFSLQLLAVVKSSRSDSFSPLIIFTRPPDVYTLRHWLVATALENVFSSIQDCLIIPSADGALDNIVISSSDGISVAWYHGRSWQYRRLCCSSLSNECGSGRLCAGRIGHDASAFIVSTSANGGSKLSIYNKQSVIGRKGSFRDSDWSQSVLDDFSDGHSASILDVLCEDLNDDGVDEIIVSVSSRGSNAGIYCFVREGSSFLKYKLCDEAAIKLSVGYFALKNKPDLAMITCRYPHKILVHYHSFVSSQILPRIEDSELIFSIPRISTSICDIDVIDLAGYTISLIILPPNSFLNVAADGSEAVKVLHGLIGWIDSQSELIERTRVACDPGCVTPMLVDSPEGHVRSGDDGAVFVRMRPSVATDAVNLSAINVLPSYFPCDIRNFEFSWQPSGQQAQNRIRENNSSDDCYHLKGFRIRFNDTPSTEKTTADVSYIHFWAAAPGFSTIYSKDITMRSPFCNISDHGQTYCQRTAVCSIRASLSNPTGEGGLVYCQDPLSWGATPPTPYQIARARKMTLPILYEHGPFWRSVQTAKEDGESEVGVEYPWHSWVAGRSGRRRKGQMKWDIWAAFDFPAFEVERSHQRGTSARFAEN